MQPAARARAQEVFGVAAFADFRDLLALPGIEAVSICLPDNLHREAALGTLAAGKHLLLEKPLAMCVEEGEEICQAAARSGCHVMVGHLLRFDPRYALAREAFQSGRLGELVHVYARRNSAVLGPTRYGPNVSLAWHVTVHDIDLIRWITGEEVVRVTAEGSARVLARAGQTDSLAALLKLASGAFAVVESCWVLPEAYGSGLDAQLEIVGTHGVLEVKGLDQGLRIADTNGWTYPDTMRHARYGGRVWGLLREEVEQFVDAVLGGKPPLVPCVDALAALRVVQAIDRALAEERPIAMAG